MRESVAAALLALATFLLLGGVGFQLNDEMDLGAAAYNFYAGRLPVTEIPPEYYSNPVVQIPPRTFQVGGEPHIAESRGALAPGLLVYPFVVFAAWLGSAQLLVVALATSALFGGLALALAQRHARLPERTRRVVLAAFLAAAGAFLVANLLALRRVPLDPWGPALAAQLGTAILAAAGVGAFHRFVALRSGDAGRAHLAAGLLVAGTTLPFWGVGLKYHAGVIASVAVILLLRFVPGAGVAGAFGAYVVAGLTAWLNPVPGGLLALALAAADGARALRGPGRAPRVLRSAAVACFGVALGLSPYVAESLAVYGTPLAPGYLAPHLPPETATGPGGGAPDAAQAVEKQQAILEGLFAGILRAGATRDPGAVPAALFTAWVVPDPHVMLYGLLVLSPLLVLAGPGIALVARRRAFTDLDLFLGAFGALTVWAYAFPSLNQGQGIPFARFYTPLYPALAWYAALYMRSRLRDDAKWLPVVAAATLPLLLAATALLVATLHRDGVARLFFLRELGLAVLLLVLVGTLAAEAADRLPRARPWTSRFRVGVWSVGLLPTAWFLVEHLLVEPSRVAWTGVPGGPLAMMVPVVDVAAALLRAAVG